MFNLKSNFLDFPDPRKWACIYPAWYLVLIILCGYLSGCNTISDITHFAQLRQGWFADLVGERFGAPSYDTLWRFLVRVEPKAFKELIARWLRGLPQDLKDVVLAIDGKRLNGISENEHVCHLVELFATERGLVIAQEKVPSKSGEVKALPALLDSVDVRGAIVSMDAAYANIGALNEVLKRGADYIVGIKGNQGNLEAEVKNYFDQANAIQYGSEEFKCYTSLDKGHGRIETRHVCVSRDLEWLPQRDQWNLKSLVEVRSERRTDTKIENGVLYYGSSREGTPEQFAGWIRGHWGIENGLHYIMDVVFLEDASLSDVGHSAENMALIRRLAANVVKAFDPKRGMTDARRNATYEPLYLTGLLGKLFIK